MLLCLTTSFITRCCGLAQWSFASHNRHISLRLYLSTNSNDNTATTELSEWHSKASKVPLADILPIGLGNVDSRANIAAFFGDQRLKFHVGLVLRQRQDWTQRGVGWLTQVTAQAVSNDLLASHLTTILPVQGARVVDVIQKHDSGTMVEAAVDAVQDDAAVAELASWLVDQSLQLGDRNAKGRLIERGGTVSSVREPGYKDHEPVFTARAKLKGVIVKAQSRSKAAAEQAAAVLLLEKLGALSKFEDSEMQSSRSDQEDAKGRLIRIGGSVSSKRDASTPADELSFVAVAVLGGESVTARGKSKKEAEQTASRNLMKSFSAE